MTPVTRPDVRRSSRSGFTFLGARAEKISAFSGWQAVPFISFLLIAATYLANVFGRRKEPGELVVPWRTCGSLPRTLVEELLICTSHLRTKQFHG